MQKMMTESEVSEATGFKTTTLRQWRAERRGPRFIKIGRSVRYREVDIEVWIDEHNNEVA